MGTEKCIVQAREHVYWPGINAQIKEMVSNCSACMNHRNQQPAETVINYEIPVTPWTKVAADIFHLHGKL